MDFYQQYTPVFADRRRISRRRQKQTTNQKPTTETKSIKKHDSGERIATEAVIDNNRRVLLGKQND